MQVPSLIRVALMGAGCDARVPGQQVRAPACCLVQLRDGLVVLIGSEQVPASQPPTPAARRRCPSSARRPSRRPGFRPRGGRFGRPAEIDVAGPPPAYQRGDALAQALGMTRPVIEEASRQLGFPPEFLRRLSRHLDLVAAIERELDSRDSGP